MGCMKYCSVWRTTEWDVWNTIVCDEQPNGMYEILQCITNSWIGCMKYSVCHEQLNGIYEILLCVTKFQYSTVRCFLADSLRSSRMQPRMNDCSFTQRVWTSTIVVYLMALFWSYMAGGKWNCCHLGTHSVNTIQPCTRLKCHFIWSHIYRVPVCLCV